MTMTTAQTTTDDGTKDAVKYIDAIRAINQKYGVQCSDEAYDEAIEAATEAFRHLATPRTRSAANS